jgi:UDP-N-acetylmuramoyl-tripeptide--D-alanyl-D-alanine ligase
MKEFSTITLARIIKAHIEKGTSGESHATSLSSCFTGVSIDSRTTEPGDCFFAIPGENFDGHDYIADAFAKGAVCAVVNQNSTSGHVPRGTVLRVCDTIKALGDFAHYYRQKASFKVVAITGSVGKTTTRQIAYHALSRRFRVVQAPKNFNNNIGLPLTLLSANPDDQIVIAELGTNHPGEIAYLTGIAQPDIAVVTNIYPAHLEGFGSLQTIIQEKLSISDGLRPNGVLIINAGFGGLIDACRAKGVTFMTFGGSAGSDYRVQNIAYDGFSSSFTIYGPGQDASGTDICLPIPGPGNVQNALAAWAICSQCGSPIDDFARAVKTLPNVSMRVEPLRIGTLTVLNDCYNANPASMKNALDILARLYPVSSSAQKGRLVFICGDMAELGEQAEALHNELGASIARAGVQVLLAVGKSARITAAAAKNAAEYALRVECFEDNLSACRNLEKFIEDDDIILVKGSRTAKLEMAVEKLKELFS